MVQINFSIPDQLNAFLLLLSNEQKISKSALAKQFFLQGIKKEVMPTLAKLYQDQKISLKTISEITQMSLTDVMRAISQFIDDLMVDDDLIDYSDQISKKLLDLFQKD
ncbi:MAG: hypothetical protein DRO88_00695 [Promethearchaeia archaeon]|nr:MAG: hypothetical protein DRO88_00695 [Candidatus Lokiarchaeia archaeon]